MQHYQQLYFIILMHGFYSCMVISSIKYSIPAFVYYNFNSLIMPLVLKTIFITACPVTVSTLLCFKLCLFFTLLKDILCRLNIGCGLSVVFTQHSNRNQLLKYKL